MNKIISTGLAALMEVILLTGCASALSVLDTNKVNFDFKKMAQDLSNFADHSNARA